MMHRNRSSCSLAAARAIAVIAVIATLILWARADRALGAPHPGLATTASIRVERDGSVEVRLTHDVLAFALNEQSLRVVDEDMLRLLNGASADLERALAEARERFAHEASLTADGEPVMLTVVEGPTAGSVLAWRDSRPMQLLPVKQEFVARATIPLKSRRIAVKFPEVLGDVVATVQTPGAEPLGTPVRAGSWSEDLAVDLSVPPFVPRGLEKEPAPAHGGSVASWRAAWGFVWMGFEHILPLGVDHILFVLGLFFLSPKVRPLLVQITAFTAAHSVTLALSARGVIQLPGSLVEPIIAASIAFVAIENICTTKVHWWRTLVVFVFGLIHGLGFAAAFAEAFGAEKIPLGPVVLFNVGVELGQLAVVGLALLAVGWFREKKWYRPWIAIPCSVVIAGLGVWWTVERVFL